MSAHDRVRWDDIYRQRGKSSYPAPDPLLLNYTPHVGEDEEKRALDLAGGVGQNGLWLSAQGYIVDIMEISRIALTRAREEMVRRDIRNVNLLQIDLDDVDFEEQRYDVVCVFRYLKRSFLPKIRAATVPGGRIIYETFNVSYLQIVPDFNQEFLLHPGELVETFRDWHIIQKSEDDHISQIVAVKPDGIFQSKQDDHHDPFGGW